LPVAGLLLAARGKEVTMRPVVLCILDGWGLRPDREANAVALAHTPNFDRFWESCPHATLALTCAPPIQKRL
jgi:2,3-bisphosphoglycerate-independent phosphoglycerate mutase